MPNIRFAHITKSFGKAVALKDLSLEIAEGEFLTLLGPSGCGKTTTLRALAGLEEPDSGEIHIGDRCVFAPAKGIFVPPAKRNLGMVFQSYALWPHMTVRQNIDFGLREARLPKNQRDEKIRSVLQTLGLGALEHRYPHELSGGQQQRVALARMVVVQPPVLLFDEPLSNLDAKLRMTLRSELKKLHRITGATSVYVTHDHVEALTLSDRIVVMNAGEIQQIGTPNQIYRYPANLFVAEFMGNPKANLVPAIIRHDAGCVLAILADGSGSISLPGVAGLQEGQSVVINARSEDLSCRPKASNHDGMLLEVETVMPAGSECLVYAHSPHLEEGLIIRGTPEEYEQLEPGEQIRVVFKRLNVYDAESRQLLQSWEAPVQVASA